MKRIVMAVLFSALMAGAAFAEIPAFKMSAGGGLMLNTGFGGGVEFSGVRAEVGAPLVGFGAFGFFDATFVEADIGVSVGSAKAKVVGNEVKGTLTSIHFSVLGKYPFQLGRFSVFPLLGMEYQLSVAGSGDMFSGTTKAGDMSSFWFKGGVGGDFSLTEKLYIRGEFLYGIRLANKAEKDLKDLMGGGDTKIGHGPGIKVAVGYSF